jgi:ATP-dependent Clp protease ATP-binding subunit ClpA
MVPFDRFTERAKKALTLAQEEAEQGGADHLGTEHLLVGVVRAGGRAVVALERTGIDVDVERVRRAATSHVRSVLPVPGARLAAVPEVRVAIERAFGEAAAMGDNHVGTEHLLVGLMLDEDCAASRALADLGATAVAVRERIVEVLAEEQLPPPFGGSTALPVATRCSADGRQVIRAAERISGEFGRSGIDPVDLLAALLAEDGVTARFLARLGVDVAQARRLLTPPEDLQRLVDESREARQAVFDALRAPRLEDAREHLQRVWALRDPLEERRRAWLETFE